MSEIHSALEHTVTAVKIDRKKNKEYILSIEHIEEPIVVHEDMFIKYRLMKGQCLTSSLIAEIIEVNGKYMAYIKAIRYLGVKARSSRQIADYLKRQEFNDEHISHALERLQKDGYVNDEQYAIAYVQSKTRIQGNGRVKIAHDLK
ncbi:MAG TPA: RecX family transcriptional regulator, partial [Candidatus Paenibacillus intestinavium]|nr:RecX family transcriptional regulator [Candidatus Paenibacillus intestinavium]